MILKDNVHINTRYIQISLSAQPCANLTLAGTNVTNIPGVVGTHLLVACLPNHDMTSGELNYNTTCGANGLWTRADVCNCKYISVGMHRCSILCSLSVTIWHFFAIWHSYLVFGREFVAGWDSWQILFEFLKNLIKKSKKPNQRLWMLRVWELRIRCMCWRFDFFSWQKLTRIVKCFLRVGNFLYKKIIMFFVDNKSNWTPNRDACV